MVEISSHDCRAFRSWGLEEVLQVTATLRDASSRVAAGTMPASRFEELEMSVGITWNADGLLADTELCRLTNPVHAVTYDWAHNMLQDGVFTSEAGAFLVAAGLSRDAVQGMLLDRWEFPAFRRTKMRELHRVFDIRRVSAEHPNKIKASCSEMLGLYGLLRHIAEVHVADTPDILPHKMSFFAACKVLDLLLYAKAGFANAREASSELTAATCEFLHLHKQAYGTGLVKPKHHWQVDVGDQLLRDGLVLDSFVVERNHLLIKAVTEKLRNTQRFEASACASMATVCWQNAKDMTSSMRLLGAAAPLVQCPGCFVADRLELHGVIIAVGDVITSGDNFGIVIGCCHYERLGVLVRAVTVELRVSHHSYICKQSEGMDVWPAIDVMQALAWKSLDEHGRLLVVRR